MKAKHLVTLILTAGITANVYAAPNPKPPPPPQDVKVINTTSEPVPVTVQNPNGERRFVGFSDTTVNGGSGWPAVNAACTSKFGSGARICTGSEIYMNSGPSLPMASDTVYGWVLPEQGVSANRFYNQGPCGAFKSTSAGQSATYIINSDTGELKVASSVSIEDRIALPGSCASSFAVTCCQ